MDRTFRGSCFCGAVVVEAVGAPVAMGYCHCGSCRSWSAGPVNAFTLWKHGTVSVIRGHGHVGVFNKTERSYRKWCTNCGGHVLVDHPGWGLTDVPAAMLPGLRFEAGVHVNYEGSVLRIHDGLPKLRDFPAELGGTGETTPE